MFDSVVFAGGGSRCVWQVGFWHAMTKEVEVKPKIVSAVSAGSCMAAMLFSNTEHEGMELFDYYMGRNEKNFYPTNVLKPSASVFPQEAIYRKVLLKILDNNAINTLKSGPDIRVFLARSAPYLGAKTAALVGYCVYNLEKKIHHPLHPTWGKKIGFRPEVVSMDSCQTSEELVELILQSSCTPPFTKLCYRNGKVVLDGGLVDNVPVEAIQEHESQNMLVLLSRKYPEGTVPEASSRRTYAQPSEPIPVTTWDYASPEKIKQTYEIGLKDGEKFAKSLI